MSCTYRLLFLTARTCIVFILLTLRHARELSYERAVHLKGGEDLCRYNLYISMKIFPRNALSIGVLKKRSQRDQR